MQIYIFNSHGFRCRPVGHRRSEPPSHVTRLYDRKAADIPGHSSSNDPDMQTENPTHSLPPSVPRPPCPTQSPHSHTKSSHPTPYLHGTSKAPTLPTPTRALCHLVDVQRAKTLRKLKGHPQPVWFTPF